MDVIAYCFLRFYILFLMIDDVLFIVCGFVFFDDLFVDEVLLGVEFFLFFGELDDEGFELCEALLDTVLCVLFGVLVCGVFYCFFFESCECVCGLLDLIEDV